MHPQHCESLHTRILYTVHRSAKATFVTSLTTAACFLATSVSRMIPIAAFGIFACLCIVCLFVVNTLVMPPALIAWEGNFAHLPFGVCCSRCPCVDVDQVRPCA
jgi:predicted RND superfamily exporter protein